MVPYDTIVRFDFVIAVGLLVVAPLALLVVSVAYPPVRGRLLVYWRASALLGITVYLWAGEVAMGFATGVVARALIPIALWWGDALLVLRGQSVPDDTDWRAVVYRYWRVAAVAYSLAGVAYMLPLLPCAAGPAGPTCEAWYGPPQQFTAWLHPSVGTARLGRYGSVGLVVYATYLLASAVRLWQDRGEGRGAE